MVVPWGYVDSTFITDMCVCDNSVPIVLCPHMCWHCSCSTMGKLGSNQWNAFGTISLMWDGCVILHLF